MERRVFRAGGLVHDLAQRGKFLRILHLLHPCDEAVDECGCLGVQRGHRRGGLRRSSQSHGGVRKHRDGLLDLLRSREHHRAVAALHQRPMRRRERPELNFRRPQRHEQLLEDRHRDVPARQRHHHVSAAHAGESRQPLLRDPARWRGRDVRTAHVRLSVFAGGSRTRTKRVSAVWRTDNPVRHARNGASRHALASTPSPVRSGNWSPPA